MLFSGVGGRVILFILRLFPFVNVLHLPNSRYAMPGKPGGNVEKVLAWQAVEGAKEQESCEKVRKNTRKLLQMSLHGGTL